MATEVQRVATNTANRKAASERKQGKSGLVRLAWIVLVGIIPLLFALVVVACALQLVGVPVWQTTVQLTGAKASHHESTAIAKTTQQLATAKEKIAKLQQQNQTLTAKTQADTRQLAALTAAENTLRQQLQAQTNSYQQGQREGKVLAQMDSQTAASVLQSMGVSKASWIVATMTPDVSGSILQSAPTTFASAVLQQAAKDEALAAKANNSQNATG